MWIDYIQRYIGAGDEVGFQIEVSNRFNCPVEMDFNNSNKNLVCEK